MKKFFCFLFFSLFLITGCSDVWHKTIDDNQITIKKSGDYLDITVFVPQKNLEEFESHDDYVFLLTEAFADYLKLSNDSEFECPGLETVSEKTERNGHTTLFRIPQKALKVIRK